MTTFNIEFSIICQTRFGQKVCICGNIPQLGNWNIHNGIRLITNTNIYPLWQSQSSISIRQDMQIQFKLYIINAKGHLIRWQQLQGNRSCFPKKSLRIEFIESDPSINFKQLTKANKEILKIKDFRKGTDKVIKEWGSDSSSNEQMWKQHKLNDNEEQQLLLTQFTTQLIRTITSQRQDNYFMQFQIKMELYHQIKFGNYDSHYYHTHYVLSMEDINDMNCIQMKEQRDKIVMINKGNLINLQKDNEEQISIFHVLDWDNNEDISQFITQLNQRWFSIPNNSRGLIIVYIQSDKNTKQFKQLINLGVNSFVISSLQSINHAFQAYTDNGYNIYCICSNIFTAINSQGMCSILYYTPFNKKHFLINFKNQLSEINLKILKHFYFNFPLKQSKIRLSQKFSLFKMKRSKFLIILYLQNLQQLQNHTLFELIKLNENRFKIIIFIIINTKFPKYIYHLIPVAKYKIIFINIYGDIYSGNGEIIDLFTYIEIDKEIYINNQKRIIEELGAGFRIDSSKNQNLIIYFQRNLFGEILKQRAKNLARDINNKSIAKLIIQQKQNSLQFIPQCLHLSFIYKVILTTFSSRLKYQQKGIVINIDGVNSSSLNYLKIPQGIDNNINFIPFCLQKNKDRTNIGYACNPIKQNQLISMFEMISQEYDHSHMEIEREQNEHVLGQIKNIR